MKLRQTLIFSLLLSAGLLFSCTKYDDGEVIENSFLGAMYVNKASDHPEGNFISTDDNGNFTFAWENNGTKASAQLQLENAQSGSVQMVIRDKKDKIVLQEVLLVQDGPEDFAKVSDAGKSGIWEISLIFTDYTGEGSYEIKSVD